MKRRYIGIFLSVLLIVGLIGWTAVVNQRKANGSIQTAAATTSTFVKSIQSSGKTKADQSVDLMFQTAGRLSWVNVKIGDTVTPYQVIAGLDAREVQKTLEKALIDYSVQRNTFEDTRRFNHPADKPEDALTLQMKHILEKNQWNLQAAVLDVELEHLAVEYATLVTPIGGIVTRIDTPIAGVNITPTTSVFTVSSPSSLVFEAKIDETDVGKLTVGQAATIALDAFPESTFSGTISYISYTSEVSAGGATVFPVKVSFTGSDVFRIGLNGDVTIVVDQKNDVLQVPIEAIREDEGGSYVYKKLGSGFVKTPIIISAQNDTQTVIESGLAEGDAVVVKGFDAVSKEK